MFSCNKCKKDFSTDKKLFSHLEKCKIQDKIIRGGFEKIKVKKRIDPSKIIDELYEKIT